MYRSLKKILIFIIIVIGIGAISTLLVSAINESKRKDRKISREEQRK